MTNQIEPFVKFASKDKKKLMFSHNLTLSQFVCSIPICQLEADLGSILYIFHQTGCDCIAILQKDRSWGIISSSKLLGLLANPKQRLAVTSGHPKKTFNLENFAFETSKAELAYSIEPAIVYQANTKLPEFLQSIAGSYSKINRSNYLIVNSAGQLEGKLDVDKLLKYIGSKVTQNPNLNLSLPTSSIPLLNLLDDLTLPLKIETVEQKNCYENHCWQKLISCNLDNHLIQAQELNVSIANWWVRKQLTALQKKQNQQHQSINKTLIDSIGDFGFVEKCHDNPYQSDARIPLTNSFTQQPSIEHSQDIAKTLLDNLHSDRVDCVPVGIQVEEGINWNYIKIPLTLEEKSLATPKISHWLILAIKPSLLPFSDRDRDSDSTINKSTVDRLLAIISHELKSPLTGILGLSNLLNTQKLGKLNQRQAEYIKLIHNSGQKLMTIVNDLIELTSLTTKKFELQPEEIELEALFDKLYQQVIVKFQAINSVESDLLISSPTVKNTAPHMASPTSKARLNHITPKAMGYEPAMPCLATSGIELNIEPGLELAIADRLRLSSIVSHLMLETVQFPNATSIAVKIKVRSEGKHIAIVIKNRVEDTEICLSKDSEKVGQNIGLNLIIAKYLAHALHADIKSVYSSTGCAFTLLLPKIDSAAISSTSIETTVNNHNIGKNLTVLCLYPEIEAIDSSIGDCHGLDFDLKKWTEQNWSGDKQLKFAYRHRIIEADGLEQAHTLARIWQLDVIVLDGSQITNPEEYLKSLQRSEYLSTLPIITLDAKTTQAANQVKGLNVYPCLLPAQCRSIEDLMQVIQIATEQ